MEEIVVFYKTWLDKPFSNIEKLLYIIIEADALSLNQEVSCNSCVIKSQR